MIHHAGAQRAQQSVEGFLHHRLGDVGPDAEAHRFPLRRPTADAELEPTAGEVIEHADLFSQSKRRVHRQQVDARYEFDACRSLRQRGEKDTRRRRNAKRRGVVFGHVVCGEACVLGSHDDPEAILIQVADGGSGASVDPVEHAPRQCCHDTHEPVGAASTLTGGSG